VPERRLRVLRATVCAGLIAGLLLSPKLWVSIRFYPLTSITAFLKPLPYPFDYAIYILLIALLAASALAPRSPWPVAASVLLLAALCAQDQSRLQPWCYQYACMLIALAQPASGSALNVCRLIIAAIYFWSGAEKLNPYFASGTFTYLAQPIAMHFPVLVLKAGYAAPFVEMAGGIGLLARKLRVLAVAMLIAMHVLILLAIGPFGHNSNTVVWPWNLAMILFLVLLFNHNETPAREILLGRATFHRLVFALFALAPALSFFNLWDSYLSSALYSGNRNQGVIYMTESVAAYLPDEVDEDIDEEPGGAGKLLINDWSFDELNVPAYPEPRIYKNAARKLCEFAVKPSDVRLELRAKAVLGAEPATVVLNCSDLH
jgi:hypothetical protein